MKQNMKEMKCGACGNNKVTIYTDERHQLTAECTECKSTTDLIVRKPKIEFEFAPGSDGILCVF